MTRERKTMEKDVDVKSLPNLEDEGAYGWFSIRPKWIRFVNNPGGFLLFICLFLLAQGMILNGILYVIISSLETRFLLNSRQTGTMSSMYHLAYLIFGLFITFYANRAHRPLMLSLGSAILGLGCLIFALPHFTSPLYDYGQNDDGNSTAYCGGSAVQNCTDYSDESKLQNYLYVFYLAQFINGIGCVPLYTVSFAVIEDCLPAGKAGLYNGIANSMTILGPTIGYILGGYFLTIYVDFVKVGNPDDLTIYDPAWVGAWWLGYLLATAILWIFVAVPLAGFTRQIPGTAKAMAERVSEVHENEDNAILEDENFGKTFRDLPFAMWTLFKITPYLFTLISSVFDAFCVTGFSVFLAKIIEHQFHQPAAIAALWAGLVAVPGGIFGTLIAGFVVHRWNLSTRSCIIYAILCGCAVLATFPFSVIYCEETQVVGINRPYFENSTNTNYTLTSVCNANCECPEDKYTPVCSVYEEAVYFTACHAGCRGETVWNETNFYNYCSCVKIDPFWTYRGLCEWGCEYLSTYLVLIFFMGLFNFMAVTPTTIVQLRTIPASQRSFGLGLNGFFYRFGSIPGPTAYGAVIDLACIYWQQLPCDGGNGSCFIYDSSKMALDLLWLGISFKGVAVLCMVLALITYKPISENKSCENEETDKVNIAYENKVCNEMSETSVF